jgi:galactosylceramidase
LDGFTILGDAGWKDYQVSVDVSVVDGGFAALLGRVGRTHAGATPSAYILRFGQDGAWTLGAGDIEIASGKATIANAPWHNMKLVFKGTSIGALIDHQEVASLISDTFAAGMVGLGTLTSSPYFDNLIINEVDGVAPQPAVFFQDDLKNHNFQRFE